MSPLFCIFSFWILYCQTQKRNIVFLSDQRVCKSMLESLSHFSTFVCSSIGSKNGIFWTARLFWQSNMSFMHESLSLSRSGKDLAEWQRSFWRQTAFGFGDFHFAYEWWSWRLGALYKSKGGCIWNLFLHKRKNTKFIVKCEIKINDCIELNCMHVLL